MLGPRSVSRNSNHGGAANPDRRGMLMSKLLARVSTELKNRGVQPTAELLDAARSELERRWSDHGLNDREIRDLVSALRLRSRSAMSGKISEEQPSGQQQQQQQNPPRSFTPDATASSEMLNSQTATPTESQQRNMKEVLKSTSRRQRQLMADAEWIRASENDRVAGAVGRKNDRLKHLETLEKQRQRLDGQIEEHNRQKEEERQARIRGQKEMDETIERVRQLTHQERMDALNKAMKEKQFREDQTKELERQREQARIEEHNEQVRHMMMIQQELAATREQERQRKLKEKSDWERTLQENQEKLQQKAAMKQRERQLDREFQREQEEAMDREEKRRADAKAAKAAKAAYFQQLANGVAKMHMSKEQDLTDKIESEYQEQLRRAREDEAERKRRNKQRLLETQQTLDRQCNQKKIERERERQEAIRLAESLRQQNAEIARQEEMRKQAQKQEAQRMKEFLGTQLQLQHFKETKPLETSIARPQSRAKTMYSPSRYSPSEQLQ